MQRHIFIRILLTISFFSAMQEKTYAATHKDAPTIYIDKKGIMRWSDTHQEATFFGVNYTLPFAHAYRVLNYLNGNHKEAIDKDVYHFARLGFNAYRIHIWDVEISDEQGNLIENEHLDLLDYLIGKLKERNIKIVLTVMTNFGNGYPEKDKQTGGFSYAYDKCDIHQNPEAIKAQEQYIGQLVNHINPYTGKAYKDDPDVVGFEINNEPCHPGSKQKTKSYIDRMLASLWKTGNRKPVFYNVSHNREQLDAYYATDIQGTTYQWYPTGLVAGHTRKGNFLPYVDNYHIPFRKIKGFANKAMLVYEYDPADITYSYIHPAIVRSFRTAGFQWITQFAYDPMDIARTNTDYQTHYLNLAYTPQKAISMKIAAEATYTIPRNHSYGTYPNDTLFEHIRVSYRQDLSELNTPEKFFYSNTTTTRPADLCKLTSIAGYGNSPIVRYEGTGAYFIDKLEEGLWRLEIMPDAVQISDPFAKPSLDKEVVTILWNNWDMTLHLPKLQDGFTVTGINEGNSFRSETNTGMIQAIHPGVYLLQLKNQTLSRIWDKNTRWGNIQLDEYAAPPAHANRYNLFHQPQVTIESGKELMIEAQVAGPALPDSVIIYTDQVSFWNKSNPYVKMERIQGYTYQAIFPGEKIQTGIFRYTFTVCRGDERTTFPAGTARSPLDWDYTRTDYFESRIVSPSDPVNLFTVQDEYSGMETYTMPEWSQSKRETVVYNPVERPILRFTFCSPQETPRFYLRKYIGDDIRNRTTRLKKCKEIGIYFKEVPDTICIGFITTFGYTYTTIITPVSGSINRIPLAQLRQTVTALLPEAYPVFLNRYFKPETDIPFRPEDVEQVELSFNGKKREQSILELGSIWLE